MSDQTAILYEKSTPAECLAHLAETMPIISASLCDPKIDEVLEIDEEGEIRITKYEAFVERLVGMNEVRFLWRFGANDNRYCRVRRIGSISAVEFSLDGCDVSDVQRLRSLLERYCMARSSTSLGVLIDLHERLTEFDWDRFFERSTAEVPEHPDRKLMPDVVFLPTADLGRLGAAADAMLRRDTKDWTCLERH